MPVMMKCPRCVQKIHRAAESCPHCGFSLADADLRFGGGDVRLRCLTDKAGLLRTRERLRVEAAMERFARRFPQVFVAIYTEALGDGGQMRQFGFWLLNRGAFEDVPYDKPNACGVLMVIDPEEKMAGMTYGYLLDPFMDEGDTFEVMSRGHAHWLEGRYMDGMLKAIEQLEIVLKRRSRQARRNGGRFERALVPPGAAAGLGQRLRAGRKEVAK